LLKKKNVDILSDAVRHGANSKHNASYAPSVNTQMPWDERNIQEPERNAPTPPVAPQRTENIPYHPRNRSMGASSDRGTPVPPEMQQHNHGHSRNGSGVSPYPPPPAEYPEHQTARRHDYDVQSMETSLVSPRASNANNIPAPTVTVRSEYPTLTRSRQQQSLTCLITIEVGEPKMRNTPLEMSHLPPIPQGPSSDYSGIRSPGPPFSPPARDPAEDLERITEELRGRVENWHGLDFPRFVWSGS
jgi:hypothetical protein